MLIQKTIIPNQRVTKRHGREGIEGGANQIRLRKGKVMPLKKKKIMKKRVITKRGMRLVRFKMLKERKKILGLATKLMIKPMFRLTKLR